MAVVCWSHPSEVPMRRLAASFLGIASFAALAMLIVASPSYAVMNHSGNITSNEKWLKSDVHVLTGDVTVIPGVPLPIGPGTVIKANPGCGLYVDGTLNAMGLSDSIIYFTSIRDDVGGDTNGDGSGTSAAAGDWERIKLSSTSSASTLGYCTVRYGGILGCCTNYVPLVDVIGGSPSFNNCVFSNSAIQAVSITGTGA